MVNPKDPFSHIPKTMICPVIFEPYGPKYDPNTSSSSNSKNYENWIKCASYLCKPWYSLQVMFDSGPIVKIDQAQLGFLSEFGKFKEIKTAGVH